MSLLAFLPRQSEPEWCLTYRVSPAFVRYVQARDGRKGWIWPFILVAILSFFLSPMMAVSNLHLPTVGSFLVAFLGYGAFFFLANLVRRQQGYTVRFFHDGIAGSRHRTPYDNYGRVKIGPLVINNVRHVVVAFVPRRQTWLSTEVEFGFETGTDVAPLVDFLKNKGLPVEEMEVRLPQS